MWNILFANILFVHCTFTDFLAPSAKHFSYQLFAVIWHYSNLVYTSVLCLKSSKSILATHWNNFTWGVWLYFQTPLDWLALFPLACVRCFAATFAPPPSSGPHLHQSTRLAACTLTRSCYKLCELTILWGLFFLFVLLQIIYLPGSKFRFSFTPWFSQQVVKSAVSVEDWWCMFIPKRGEKEVVSVRMHLGQNTDAYRSHTDYK